VTESKAVYAEFFAGDFLDRELVAFIDSLRPAHKTGLITNAWGDMRSYLGREKVTGAFDVLIVSAEVGVLKPQSRIYELALAQADVTAQEAIFVDDTVVNVEAAAKLGMTGILFKDREQTISEINRLI
jgi:putative hydrolase of the HAD superfamily